MQILGTSVYVDGEVVDGHLTTYNGLQYILMHPLTPVALSLP